MNKIRILNFEISEIEKSVENRIEELDRILFNYGDMVMIASFAIAKTIEAIDNKVDGMITLDEAAETFQTLMELTNNDKYKPLIKLLQKIGGD